ncbi:MAG: protein-methionine-sulfoxide reductase catalytic subunit MsrP [Nitratireductor sp.]|nr:protein-methionine-sulfoxide reductase catalytic subunit MsrP [Nitratireductor sp.]
MPSSQITPKSVWMNRRQLIAAAGAAALVPAALRPARAEEARAKLSTVPWPKNPTDLKPTPYEYVTGYNNFYEFGTGKEDPAENAHTLTTKPWTVKIDGLVDKPGDYALEDIVPATVEERIYRFRCVEAWAMVVPWDGFELSVLLNKVGVQSGAKYVAFETLVRPEEMPAQRGLFQPLEWPYVEGLRLDEAMHPLTILATGLYGEEMPNQNGAPLRLVVPWKYGFKSIKSIVRVTLTDKQPPTTWNKMAANEYGFYSNVNPTVDHPRWSQASERVVGGGLLAGSQPTLMFNGYEAEVAGLYAGLDLKANY